MRTIIALMLLTVISVNEQRPQKNFISFEIKNAGITVDGHFESFRKTIRIDDATPNNSTFDGRIEVKSINTGIGKRDRDLMKSGYFDQETYPYIEFHSESVKHKGKNTYSVTGILEIKGEIKRITFDVLRKENNNVRFYITSFTLNRRDFGVGGSSFILSDELKVNLNIPY